MSTQQEIPTEHKATGVRRPGPGEPSVEADISSSHGTFLVFALIAIVAGIFFSALFANGLYRSAVKEQREAHGNPSMGGPAIKARQASAKLAEEGGSFEDGDGNTRNAVPLSEASALLLASADSLQGNAKHQIATEGETADIPELPSYEAVLDPEAAAAADAEDEEDADEEADDADAEDEDAEESDDEDGAEDAEDDDDDEEDADDDASEDDDE